MIPIITTPWFVRDVFDREIFTRRQLDVREGSFAASLDRELEYRVQFFVRNHERSAPILVTLQERSLARKFRLEPGEDFLEMRFRQRRRDRVVKRMRFFIELQAFAFHDVHSCRQGGQLLC